jgi:hypothetical protein
MQSHSPEGQEREELRNKIMAAMMPLCHDHDFWRNWPGTWAFAEAALRVIEAEQARAALAAASAPKEPTEPTDGQTERCPDCGVLMEGVFFHFKDCPRSARLLVRANHSGVAAIPAPEPFSYEEGREQRIAFLSKLSPEDMLEELLAVIHGDGGHYSDQHGLPKAVADAETKWYARGVVPSQAPSTPQGHQVGWAGRFDSANVYLTPHAFEAEEWRRHGFPVWPVFARIECTCPACSRGELHSSDCAVHNEPALPAGPCDCGAVEDGTETLDEGKPK